MNNGLYTLPPAHFALFCSLYRKTLKCPVCLASDHLNMSPSVQRHVSPADTCLPYSPGSYRTVTKVKIICRLLRDPENLSAYHRSLPCHRNAVRRKRWLGSRTTPHGTARSPAPGVVHPAVHPGDHRPAPTLTPCCWVVRVSLESSRSKTSQ